MKLNDLGEFGLINRILPIVPSSNPHVIEGIGDDCAVIETGHNRVLLITTDLLVENTHFIRERIPPRMLGRKTLSVNVSDIAAMGGTPTYFLLSMAIPPDLDITYLDDFFLGLKDIAEENQITIVGGDTTRSAQHIVLNITLLGEAPSNQYLTRHGSRPGDLIQVSGHLGASTAGLHILLQNHSFDRYPRLMQAHFDPRARTAVGKALALTSGVTAMIDISDGLIQDLGHICERSCVGASVDVDMVPILPEVHLAAWKLGADPVLWALSGGEDYELCWTVSPDRANAAAHAACLAGAPRVATIGRIVAGNTVHLHKSNKPYQLVHAGWDHFRS